MNRLDRRTFLKLVGAGSAVTGAGALPLAGRLLDEGRGPLMLRASTKLPGLPLPSLVTTVLEGTVDLRNGTGLLTSRVLRGHPEPAESLPGTVRLIRVTGIQELGGVIRIVGQVEDRSLLRPGERPDVEVLVDRARRIVTAPFAGGRVTLTLD